MCDVNPYYYNDQLPNLEPYNPEDIEDNLIQFDNQYDDTPY